MSEQKVACCKHAQWINGEDHKASETLALLATQDKMAFTSLHASLESSKLRCKLRQEEIMRVNAGKYGVSGLNVELAPDNKDDNRKADNTIDAVIQLELDIEYIIKQQVTIKKLYKHVFDEELTVKY